MVALKRISIQLSALMFGDAIIAAGGKAIICKTGTPDKETLYDPVTELPIANPITLVRGKMDFCVPEARNDVDIYVQAPGGQFLVERGVKPSGPNEFIVNTRNPQQMYVLPFSITDTAAAAETSTGIAIPANGAVQPSPLVKVTTLDNGQTIDVGTLSTDGGDADGFIDGVVLTNAGLVKPTQATAGKTLGTKLFVQDSANAGDSTGEQDVSQAGKTITYTLNAGTDTGKGFIYLPINLAA